MPRTKSVLDAHGRTAEFNHLQQMLFNFRGAHKRAIENKDENIRDLMNDSIERINHLIVIEQNRIKTISGQAPQIY